MAGPPASPFQAAETRSILSAVDDNLGILFAMTAALVYAKYAAFDGLKEHNLVLVVR